MKKEDHHALGTAISWLIFCIIIAFSNAYVNYLAYCYEYDYCCWDYDYFYYYYYYYYYYLLF